ncbi:hypothetical protein IQ22_04085 [Pseudomonas duriflava]|uniref:Uncharacterized protein n=1 Tax=Pseudomonas duriflava TaxID=459528 RepID=A0A562PWX0_9PSED|nr:hypothetical protein [Pseudomonas duriflava]TWI48952.1 hypothetical protein IQ22_04085 [Pseudomonas duriflava]
MQSTTLTNISDRIWLAEYHLNMQTWSAFFLARLRRANAIRLRVLAGQVRVYEAGRYIDAFDLYHAIERRASTSQIAEQWDFEVACEVHRVAEGMSASDAEVLLYAAGLNGVSLEELARSAGALLPQHR